MNYQTKTQSNFEDLVMDNLDSIYSVASRLLCDSAKAEDLVQDTFSLAFKSFSGYKNDKSFKIWLFGILAEIYKKNFADEPEALFSFMQDEADESWSNYDSLDYTELYNDDASKFLAKLPPDYKLLIFLADIENFSITEISHITKKSVRDVLSHLFLVRKALRKKSNGEYHQLKEFAA